MKNTEYPGHDDLKQWAIPTKATATVVERQHAEEPLLYAADGTPLVAPTRTVGFVTPKGEK